MKLASLMSAELAESRARGAGAFEGHPFVMPARSLPTGEPDLRWLGQLMCIGSGVLTLWLIWALVSLVH